VSGIHIHSDSGSADDRITSCPPRLVMFNEGDLPKEHDRTIQDAALRGMEILRHLPVPVAQFDQQGRIICENPESSKVFGTSSTHGARSSWTASLASTSTSSSSAATASTTSSRKKDSGDEKYDDRNKNNNSSNKDSSASMTTSGVPMATVDCSSINTFVSRFVDRKLGEHIFQTVLANGQDFMGEVQQFTIDDNDANRHYPDHSFEQDCGHHACGGVRWFAIKVRRSKDPITGQPVLLYSARDITSLHQARKEADEANLAKREFMAICAHEIRTPLHQVLGFMELLGETITRPNNNNGKKQPQQDDDGNRTAASTTERTTTTAGAASASPR
jgi:His Kinase A (phospho-acceptor) domain